MFLYYIYGIILSAYTILTWAFVDPRSNLPGILWLQPLVYFKRIYPTIWYTGTVAILFVWYLWILAKVKRDSVTSKTIWWVILCSVVLLILSFPVTSNDIFNYIATAKVAFFYKENPYLVMPIEIPNEPMLTFLNASNKVSLYGPFWIALTALPYAIGAGNLLFTIFAFKLFIVGWYLMLCYLIWKLSGKTTWNLAFFALNPLVVLTTLVDAHNDVVMMALALLAFLAVKHKRYLMSALFMFASILIKGATVFLVPVLFWYIYRKKQGKPLNSERIWQAASIAMYIIFFLSPVREELYAWYFIWPLTFLSLLKKESILTAASFGWSFGLMLRVVPFLYTRSWSGITPMVKKIVTIVPPIVCLLLYAKKRHH